MDSPEENEEEIQLESSFNISKYIRNAENRFAGLLELDSKLKLTGLKSSYFDRQQKILNCHACKAPLCYSGKVICVCEYCGSSNIIYI